MTYLKVLSKEIEIDCMPIASLSDAKKHVEQNQFAPDHKVIFSTIHENKITGEKFENIITLKIAM
jgi:hypothetical protein